MRLRHRLACACACAVAWGCTGPPQGNVDARWPSYAEAFDAVAPSVVSVTLETPEARVGTGFALTSDQVVTARHLVIGAEHASVRTWDGRTLAADVGGLDARTDLALLTVPGAELSPVSLGRSGELRVGDTVLTIGNPYGLGHSLALGVVGHRGRRLAAEAADGPRVDFLQLSIPLNPGNSGGPVIDRNGEVVGVLSGTHAQGQAIAFAVPVEALTDGLDALRRGDRVSRAFLGLRTELRGSALTVVSVVPAGPADEAGVRQGDALTAFDSRAVDTPGALQDLLDARAGGTRVSLRLLRDGQLRIVDVTLADWAEQPVVVAGMILKPLPGSGGVIAAVRPRSRAERAGLRTGDAIRSVNGAPVQAPADVKEALVGGAPAQVEVVREGAPASFQLEEAG